MADEHLVFDQNAAADERVALNLAIGADRCSRLDLDERADPRPVSDPAAIQISERLDDDPFAELDVIDQAIRGCVRGLVRHSQPAKYSSIAATTRPTWPSVIPGKIGSEMTSFESLSAIGKEPDG